MNFIYAHCRFIILYKKCHIIFYPFYILMVFLMLEHATTLLWYIYYNSNIYFSFLLYLLYCFCYAIQKLSLFTWMWLHQKNIHFRYLINKNRISRSISSLPRLPSENSQEDWTNNPLTLYIVTYHYWKQ